ncbi:MAG: translation elongation factor Ts [Candidatus Pacebacteria bacterium]|nr:translation elongation factor Ts [Candidatus Paceibacterota bacterium]MBP9839877.1 translation elongation factor Ts [Candidatus Paceibacterota bacterium]MDQ5922767.1 elongation factor Ts [Patescibacteria group bacterium]
MAIVVTTELVKELRDKTGISVMQCRKALEEAEGDMNKALAILKKSSSDIALKKADREVKDGAVMVKGSGDTLALVTLLCETDFVSKNEDFVNLLTQLADKALKDGVDGLALSAKELIDGVIQKTGENIQLGESYLVKGSVLGSYVHNNKKAVIVSLEGGNMEIAKDVAMHVAAMHPEFISKDDIKEEDKKTMTEVFSKEVENVDKPQEIKQKILQGKIDTYFKEKTLLSQPFIKNPDETIESLLNKAGAKIKEIKQYSI